MELEIFSNYSTAAEPNLDLELAADCIRWLSATVGALGVVANTLTYLTAARLKMQTSGTVLMKCLALADSVMVFMLNAQSLGLDKAAETPLVDNDFVCNVGRFALASVVHSGWFAFPQN